MSEGYSIPFKEVPSSKVMTNKSARDNTLFVKDEVRKVVQKGCVAEVKERPFVVNP